MSSSTPLAPIYRAISGLELLIGSAIVIGHNVFRIVPNEVFILFVIGLVSLRLRNGNWSAIGFRRPHNWHRLVLLALGAATLRILLGEVVEPLAERYWPPAALPDGVGEIAGDLPTALLYLLIVWTFAAFGEEIAYRGYLLRRAAELGGGGPAAWWIGVIVVAVLFGYGHFYKGPVGIIDSGIAGLVLGAAYLLSGRNLWTCVLAHGFIDTFGIIVLYFGWDS